MRRGQRLRRSLSGVQGQGRKAGWGGGGGEGSQLGGGHSLPRDIYFEGEHPSPQKYSKINVGKHSN